MFKISAVGPQLCWRIFYERLHFKKFNLFDLWWTTNFHFFVEPQQRAVRTYSRSLLAGLPSKVMHKLSAPSWSAAEDSETIIVGVEVRVKVLLIFIVRKRVQLLVQ